MRADAGLEIQNRRDRRLDTRFPIAGNDPSLEALACLSWRQIVIAEQIEEVITFLNEAVAFLNEAITASPERQVEIRMEFDRIIRKIDEIRLSNLN